MTLHSAAGPKPFHIGVLDGLRALAIAAVVWTHIAAAVDLHLQWGPLGLDFLLRTGFLGVELFFFISAACLFFPHARHRQSGVPLPGWRQYAYRRWIKIVPSYLLAMALILLVLNPAFFTRPQWPWVLLSHLGFVHNLIPGHAHVINGVFWSLGVEVQFYMLFPLLAWLFGRFPWQTYALMVATAFAYRWGVEHELVHSYRRWLDQLPGYLDCFANGMLASYMLVRLSQRRALSSAQRWGFTALAAAGFAWLIWLVAQLYAARDGYWPWAWQVEHRSYVAASFLVIAVGSAYAVRGWQRLLDNRLTRFLSIISYNLYIWHYVIVHQLLARGIPSAPPQPMSANVGWQWGFALVGAAVSILVATLVTYAFERPLLQRGFRGLLPRGASRAVAHDQAA